MSVPDQIDRELLLRSLEQLENMHFARAREHQEKAREHMDARHVYEELKNVYRHAGTVLFCLRVVLAQGQEANLVEAFKEEWKKL